MIEGEAELRELLADPEAALPWRSGGYGFQNSREPYADGMEYFGPGYDCSTLAVAAVNVLPALLAELDRLRGD